MAARAGELDPDALRGVISPELLESWMAFDAVEPGIDALIWTVAAVGSAICMTQGHDFPPATFVPGEAETNAGGGGQSDEEQIAIMTALSAR